MACVKENWTALCGCFGLDPKETSAVSIRFGKGDVARLVVYDGSLFCVGDRPLETGELERLAAAMGEADDGK